jgi:tubulinyl-Tyr carboxypeptidase
MKQKEYENAISQYIRAMARVDVGDVSSHATVLKVLLGLGDAYQMAHRDDEAQQTYNNVLKLLQVNSSSTTERRHDAEVAATGITSGRTAAELSYVEISEDAAIARRQALKRLAGMYERKNMYAEAEPLWYRVVVYDEKLLGSDKRVDMGHLEFLVDNLVKQRKWVAALPIADRLLHLQVTNHGLYHEATAHASRLCARVSYRCDLLEQSIELYQQAAESYESVATSTDAGLANIFLEHAAALQSAAKFEEAEMLLYRAIGLRSKALGATHEKVAQAREALARFYDARGRYTSAQTAAQAGNNRNPPVSKSSFEQLIEDMPLTARSLHTDDEDYMDLIEPTDDEVDVSVSSTLSRSTSSARLSPRARQELKLNLASVTPPRRATPTRIAIMPAHLSTHLKQRQEQARELMEHVALSDRSLKSNSLKQVHDKPIVIPSPQMNARRVSLNDDVPSTELHMDVDSARQAEDTAANAANAANATNAKPKRSSMGDDAWFAARFGSQHFLYSPEDSFVPTASQRQLVTAESDMQRFIEESVNAVADEMEEAELTMPGEELGDSKASDMHPGLDIDSSDDDSGDDQEQDVTDNGAPSIEDIEEEDLNDLDDEVMSMYDLELIQSKILSEEELAEQMRHVKGDYSLPRPPAYAPPPLRRYGSTAQKLHAIQRYINSFSYNHTKWGFFNTTKKGRTLRQIMDTAKEIMDQSLPIKCLEATMLGMFLTRKLDVWRFPLRFNTRLAGETFLHIVLAIKCKKTGKFGALGMSRRNTLAYKELKFDTLADLVADYRHHYHEVAHTMRKVYVGLPVGEKTFSHERLYWHFLIMHLCKRDWDEAAPVLEKFGRDLSRIENDIRKTGSTKALTPQTMFDLQLTQMHYLHHRMRRRFYEKHPHLTPRSARVRPRSPRRRQSSHRRPKPSQSRRLLRLGKMRGVVGV